MLEPPHSRMLSHLADTARRCSCNSCARFPCNVSSISRNSQDTHHLGRVDFLLVSNSSMPTGDTLLVLSLIFPRWLLQPCHYSGLRAIAILEIEVVVEECARSLSRTRSSPCLKSSSSHDQGPVGRKLSKGAHLHFTNMEAWAASLATT